MQFSERMAHIKPSATLPINAKALELKSQGVDVTSLAIGAPDLGPAAPDGGEGKEGEEGEEKEEEEEIKINVQENAERVEALSKEEKEVEAKIKQNMMIIPNIIDPSVPIGKDDSENVEIEIFGEPVVPDYEIPYHTDIMESFNGIDLESAGKVAGN